MLVAKTFFLPPSPSPSPPVGGRGDKRCPSRAWANNYVPKYNLGTSMKLILIRLRCWSRPRFRGFNPPRNIFIMSSGTRRGTWFRTWFRRRPINWLFRAHFSSSVGIKKNSVGSSEFTSSHNCSFNFELILQGSLSLCTIFFILSKASENLSWRN